MAGVGGRGGEGLEGEISSEERCGRGVGVNEAGVGELELALPWVGGVGVEGERSGEGAGSGDVGGNAGAGDAEPVEEGGGGKAGGGDLEGGCGGIADVEEVAGEGELGGNGGAGWWPGAVNVFEGVEVGGGRGETLDVGFEGLGGDEFGSAATGDLDASLDGTVADGPLGVGGEGEVAAEVGVAAEEQKTGLAEGHVSPDALQAEGDLVERAGAAKGAFEGEDAGVGGVGVSAGGMGAEAEAPLLGVGEPEGEVGVGEGDRGFFGAEFEVETGSGGFDIGKARGGAGFFLDGGGGIDVGGVEEDAVEVPFAGGEIDEVDAGVGEADGGELEAAAPEGGDAEGGVDGVGADDGLVAEGGVFVDDEVFKGQAGEREEIEGDLVEVDGAAKAFADAVGDAALVAVETDQRRKQNEEKDDQTGEDDVGQPTEGSAADGWRDVVVDEFAGVFVWGLHWVVGWVHFLHLSSVFSCRLSVLRR